MNMNEVLSKFNANQLKQINNFLNSAQGQQLNRQLSAREKQEILNRFKNLDPNVVKSKLNGLTKDDILKMLK